MSVSTTRYNPIIIGLHWFMLLLLIAVYCAMEFHGYFPKGSAERKFVTSLHFMLGMSVLFLVVIRLAVRLSSTTPAIVPSPKKWELLLAKTMHATLYIFLIAMPIAGWLVFSAEGNSVPFFGLEIPPIMGKDHQLGEKIEDLHKLGGTIGYYLIGLHALAGLFHHYVRKDNTLLRMSLLKRK
jgi:superoxide oxidase